MVPGYMRMAKTENPYEFIEVSQDSEAHTKFKSIVKKAIISKAYHKIMIIIMDREILK